MNRHILTVMDHQLNPDKYTREQLEQNVDAAYSDVAALAAAYTAGDAAYATYWLNEYFSLSGENKQDYIDAINKDNK